METALQQKIRHHKTRLLPSLITISVANHSETTDSFAQQCKSVDEHLCHDLSKSHAVNNIKFLPLVIKSGSLLIQNIDSTIVTILEKNTVLQPAIHFGNRNKLIQVKSIINNNNYSFQLTKTNVQSADEIITLLKNEATNDFSQLDQRLIVRCHLIKTGTDDDEEYLKPNDWIIFGFHQTAFDYNFVDPFIVAFIEVYNEIQFHVMNLQYSDFTLYEDGQLNGISQNATMNEARQSWSEQVHGYNQKEQYSLLTTSTQKTKKHSKRGYSVGFDSNSNLAQAQSEFASL